MLIGLPEGFPPEKDGKPPPPPPDVPPLLRSRSRRGASARSRCRMLTAGTAAFHFDGWFPTFIIHSSSLFFYEICFNYIGKKRKGNMACAIVI